MQIANGKIDTILRVIISRELRAIDKELDEAFMNQLQQEDVVSTSTDVGASQPSERFASFTATYIDRI